MASVLDISILEYFSPIFTMLMVFAVSFGIMQMTKVLGENKNLHAIVSLAMALFFGFSARPQQLVQSFTPWFVVLFFFGMFVLMGMRFMFGVEGGDTQLLNVMGRTGAGWWILIIAAVIFFISLGSIVGPGETSRGTNTTEVEPGTSSTTTSSWQVNMANTIYHPKILGMVAVLIIALVAIKALTQAP